MAGGFSRTFFDFFYDDHRRSTTLIVVILMHMVVEVRASRMHEPVCQSRFDYDYKMMNTLIDLETQNKAMLERLTELEQTNTVLNTQRKNYGTTYAVWGKKGCPGNGSTLVYSGYMASGHYQQTGSGANFLCLTSDPEWDYFDDTVSSGARIFGTEYEFWPHESKGTTKFLGKEVIQKNTPCAVCHVTRGSHVMIPGRTTCYGGWTKEYSGYLVADQVSHTAREFVCLDRRPDVLDGNENNDNESLLYFVEGECKGLPCPPYVSGREITCVVCSM